MYMRKEKMISVLIIGLFVGAGITSFKLIETAKADILINEGFETWPPAGWTNTGWLDSYYGSSHNGTHWAYSWANGDTLTTPSIAFGEDTELSFWYGAENAGHPMSLQVKLDNSLVVWSHVGFSHTSYLQAVVDLSSYSGDHTISFIGLTSDFYGQMLDDIMISYPNLPPVACFTWSDVDGTGPGTMITFNAGCSTDDYGISLYEWDWTNNGVYDYIGGPTASHDYGDANEHICALRVTDTIGQTNVISQTVQAVTNAEILDVDQSIFQRGFPIRHTTDGDWGGAQNFTPTIDYVTRVDVYIRKMGTPSWDLVAELRQGGPDDANGGTLMDTVVIPAASVSTSWTWFSIDFDDTAVGAGSDVFVVLPESPPGQPNSYGYEWGYTNGDVYQPGAFWFTRNGGGLWRDLPTMYEFCFRTYGYN